MERRLVVAIGAVLSVVLSIEGPPARAADEVESGYWSSLGLDVGASTSPAPPGGLWVARTVEGGVEAIAAIRRPVEPDPAELLLRFEVHDQIGVPHVRACRATGSWTVAENGRWADRPSVDCSVSTVAIVVDGTLTFDLRGLSVSSRLDVALVPDATTTDAFSITFAPVRDSSFTVVPSGRSAPEEPPRARVVDKPGDLHLIPGPASGSALVPPAAPPAVTASDDGALGEPGAKQSADAPVLVAAERADISGAADHNLIVLVPVLAALLGAWLLQARAALAGTT